MTCFCCKLLKKGVETGKGLSDRFSVQGQEDFEFWVIKCRITLGAHSVDFLQCKSLQGPSNS